MDNIQLINIHIREVPGGEERMEGIENLFEGIMTEITKIIGEGNSHRNPGSAESQTT